MTRSKWWAIIGFGVAAVAVIAHLLSPMQPGIGVPTTGAQGAIAVAGIEVTPKNLAIVGAGSEAVVGNGGTVHLESGYSVRSSIPSPSIQVRLERRMASGVWTPTGIEASATGDAPLTATNPSYSTTAATERIEYRFASGTAATAPVSVTYENQRLYTGLAATIYRYAAPYCPDTAVRVADLSGREAGDYQTGALLIRIDSAVGVTENLDASSQREVALHECSHELQWLNYGGTSEGFAQMKTAAAAIFTEGDNGAPPLEHAADCGARSVNPGGYLGYGGFCTESELAAGSRLLAGQRY